MMRTGMIAVVIAVVVFCSAARVNAAEPTRLSTFMRAKLDHSKKLLEALTTEDFETMAKEAQKINVLTLAETWEVLQTVEYQQQTREFRRTAEALAEAAQKKNLDGAALAYVELTMKCVNCHKYIKKHRMAALEMPALERYVQLSDER